MNFQKKRPELPQFQMTAMMDVIFLLLCFFITSSVFSQWEYEVDLVLPTASSGEMPERLPGEIIINVLKNGTASINQQELDAEGLKGVLERIARYVPGQPVIIRGDKSATYGDFMVVVDACHAAGIANLSLATQDESSK